MGDEGAGEETPASEGNWATEALESVKDVTDSVGASTLVAALTAFGFSVGAVTLAAFSSGVGVPLTDLGLDLRGYVTVAGGTLAFPALIAVVATSSLRIISRAASLERRRRNAGILGGMALGASGVALSIVAVFGTTMFADGFGPGIGEVVASVLLGYMAWALLFFALVPLLRGTGVLAGGVALLVVSMLLAAVYSHAWGEDIRADVPTTRGPIAIELVAPVARGRINVAGSTACVDRVGSNVVIGSDDAAVVSGWDWFRIDRNCTRQPLDEILVVGG